MLLRSDEEWKVLIKRHEASGLEMVRFCEQEKINYSTFRRNRRRLLSGSEQRKPPSSFMAAKMSRSAGLIEIRRDEKVCYLPSQTPAQYVADMLKAL